MPKFKGRGHSKNISLEIQRRIEAAIKENKAKSAQTILNIITNNPEHYGLNLEDIPKRRKISDIKKSLKASGKLNEVNPLDEPFHLGILTGVSDKKCQYNITHYITPEAVKEIFKIQSWLDRSDPAVINQIITIRQALWIARIFKLFNTGDDKGIERLNRSSRLYALEEIASKTGDTSRLDKAIRENKEYEYAYKKVYNHFEKVIDERFEWMKEFMEAHNAGKGQEWINNNPEKGKFIVAFQNNINKDGE